MRKAYTDLSSIFKQIFKFSEQLQLANFQEIANFAINDTHTILPRQVINFRILCHSGFRG